MATNQEGRHAAVRAITGTASDYNSDFLSLFALSGITTGTFNERFLRWINATLSTSYGSLPQAMQAYAEAQGAYNWSSLNTIVGFILDAPVLTWDDEADDGTPDFTIDFDEDIAEDDVIRFQIDDSNTFPSPTEATNTLDAAEILAGEIAMAAGALTDGTYYARVRVERSSNPISDWSNIETIVLSGVSGGTAGEAIGLLLALTKAA